MRLPLYWIRLVCFLFLKKEIHSGHESAVSCRHGSNRLTDPKPVSDSHQFFSFFSRIILKYFECSTFKRWILSSIYDWNRRSPVGLAAKKCHNTIYSKANTRTSKTWNRTNGTKGERDQKKYSASRSVHVASRTTIFSCPRSRPPSTLLITPSNGHKVTLFTRENTRS